MSNGSFLTEYKHIKKQLKSRGADLSKDDFFKEISTRITSNDYQEILDKFTPKEYFIKEALKDNEELKDKIYDLIKG